MDPVKIGERIKALRGERTMDEVATAVGTTRQAICFYEHGDRIPSDDIKKKLAAYFETTVQALFFDD